MTNVFFRPAGVLTEEQVCAEEMKGVAVVTVHMADREVSRIRKSLRVTLTDQLANLGEAAATHTHTCHTCCWGSQPQLRKANHHYNSNVDIASVLPTQAA